MSSHTPEPWSIYFNEYDGFVIRKMCPDGSESHLVARCYSGAADARLIAAAPALLRTLRGAQGALRKALPHLPADTEAVTVGEWLDEINEAIAQATGV